MLGKWIRMLVGGEAPKDISEPPAPRWIPNETWYSWSAAGLRDYPSPYGHKEVRMMRANWDEPWVRSPLGLPPETNVAGLYWQPIIGGTVNLSFSPPRPR